MAERKLAEQLKQQAWENAFKEKQRQDQLAQQKWERQMAEKEYQLNSRKVEASIAQANASIAAAKAAKAKANEVKTTGKIVNTNYCKNRSAFSSNAAYDEYNKLLWQVMNDGGIDSGILNTYLNQGKSQGIFSSKDVNAIKSQFGI